MSLTMEQLRRLAAAIKSDNLEEMDKVMREHITFPFDSAKLSQVCFLMACHLRLPSLVSKYLSLRAYPEATLYEAVYCTLGGILSRDATSAKSVDVLKVLTGTGKIDPYKPLDEKNYIISSFSYVNEEMPLIDHLVMSGDLDSVKWLLSLNSVDINKKYHNKLGEVTTLYCAQNRPQVVKLLLEKGADPHINLSIYLPDDAKTNLPSAPRTFTASFHNIVLLSRINTHGADDKTYQVYNQWLAEKQQKEEHSSGSGSNSPASASTPEGSPPRHPPVLQRTPPESPVASRNGSPMQISATGSRGSAGSSPERVASIKQTPKEKAAELLRANNNDPDETLINTMLKSENENDLEIEKLLVDSGITFKEVKGMSVLHCAASSGRFELIKYMFLKFPNLNIDMRTKSGKTVLHGACCEEYNIEILRYLLNKGCDPNAVDNNGLTPLHCLSSDGAPLVEELIKNGANPLLANKKGQIAIRWAEEEFDNMRDNEKVIKLLTVLKKVTGEAQKKQQTRAQQLQPAQSRVISSPAEIQYRSHASRPGVDDKPSYGESSSVMFQRSNPTMNNAAVTTPVAMPSATKYEESKQAGAPLFVPVPESSAKLPKSGKKADKKDNSGEKRSVVDKLKTTFHLN